MNPGQGSYRFMNCAWVILFVVVSGGQSMFASSSYGKTLMVRKLLFSIQNGVDRQPMFVVRANVETSGNPDESIELEVTIKRADNRPIRLNAAASRFYREQGGSVVYKWSSPTTSGTDMNNLFAIFPNHMFSFGQTPCVIVVRFKVTLGGLTAYLDGRTTYPVPSRKQGIQMGGLVPPDIETEKEMIRCGLDFSVYGAQGQLAYMVPYSDIPTVGRFRPPKHVLRRISEKVDRCRCRVQRLCNMILRPGTGFPFRFPWRGSK